MTATAQEKKPEFIKTDEELEEYLNFLDGLRESGKTNMFGAAPYVQKYFHISADNARKVLTYWMHTFSDRHNDN